MRVHRIPHSTNVERVALALGLKGVAVEWVDHDPADRSAIRRLTGQDLVPVLETGDGEVLVDSMAIVAWIDERHPEPPLFPGRAPARAEVEAFVQWFNLVWKVPPNAIDAERRAASPDPRLLGAWSAQMRGWQHGFEALLHGRDHLFGAAAGAADICAFPFLKYGAHIDPADDEPFHLILAEHLDLGDRFPRLRAWIERMDALPRA